MRKGFHGGFPALHFLATALLAVLLWAAPSVAGGPESKNGTGTVLNACAKCHAIDRRDAGAHRNAPPFRELARRWPPESIAEALAEGIVTGHPDMPRFELSPGQIEEIINRLRKLRNQSRKK